MMKFMKNIVNHLMIFWINLGKGGLLILIRINKDSDWYPIVADCIATAIGFGAMTIVGAFCNNIINKQESGAIKTLGMKAGKIGLETMTVYSVASEMRGEIDEMVDGINDILGVAETYRKEKNTDKSKGE